MRIPGNVVHNVLIVEDSRTQAKWMRLILESHGLDVRCAEDGESALAAMAERRPDIVVSDVVMPRMDGYDLCRRVKADPALAEVPVILVTSLSEPEETIHALEAGASNFLAKPYAGETLVERIEQTLRNIGLPQDADDAVEVTFAGRRMSLHSDTRQMTGFLVSTFEDMIAKNTQLTDANRQLEQALRTITDLESQYRRLMDTSAEAMLVIAEDGALLHANAAAGRLFHRDADGIDAATIPLPSERGERVEVEIPLPDGAIAYAEQRVVETTWDGRPALLASLWEVTENVLMRERLRELSLTDELTGLNNRRGFMVLAEQQVKLARRDRRRLVMLYADLDGLKTINDTYGHSAGDAAIVETASLLRNVLRDSDIVARMGGDEFAALLVDVAEGSPPAPAPRLIDAFARRNASKSTPWDVELSIGEVLREPDDPRDLDDLMHEADVLMYEEKARRKRERR